MFALWAPWAVLLRGAINGGLRGRHGVAGGHQTTLDAEPQRALRGSWDMVTRD